MTLQGGGTNTYTGNNSSSGATIIINGDLVLGASGLMSCPVTVGSAGTFDISQNPAFNLNQTGWQRRCRNLDDPWQFDRIRWH